MEKMAAVVWCYTGPLDKAERAFRPIRGSASRPSTSPAPSHTRSCSSLFDALYAAGLQWYWRADFFNELSAEADRPDVQARLAGAHDALRHRTCTQSTAPRIGSAREDTAWSYREANFRPVICWRRPRSGQQPAASSRGPRTTGSALHPHSSGGAYLNMIMDEGEERVKAAYRDNYARLARDQGSGTTRQNLFHVNQNIKPVPTEVVQH